MHLRFKKADIISGTWQPEGEEVVQTAEARGLSTKVLFGEASWTDYEFSAELMGSGNAALYFRCLDQDEYRNKNLVMLAIHVGSQQPWLKAELSIFEGGERHELGNSKGSKPEPGRWYTARVRVTGNRFEYAVSDGEKVVLKDSRTYPGIHPRGRVGLGTAGTCIRFRNIRVRAPDDTVLWEGLPVIDALAKGALTGAVDFPDKGKVRTQTRKSERNGKTIQEGGDRSVRNLGC